MKKVILSIIAVMAMSLSVMAQDDNRQRPQRMDRTEMIKRRTQQMVEKYGLNEEQAAALQALNEKTTPQMGGNRNGGQRPEGNDSVRTRQRRDNGNMERGERGQNRGERGDRGGNMNRGQRGQGMQRGMGFGGRNMEEYNNELQKIMTEAQYKQYTEDMKQMRERFGQGRRN